MTLRVVIMDLLRGSVIAVVQKVIFNLKVKQMVAGGKPPELLGNKVL